MCKVLMVSSSGYYAWLKRAISNRAQQNQFLVEKAKQIHKQSGRRYGSPRVYRQMKAEGIEVGRNRIARLMRENGICVRPKRRYRRTTDSEHDYPIADNIVNRNFDVEAPDRVWAGDITYIWTLQGWLYLAVIIDLFSRRVVGWALANHLRTELVLNALHMALGQRIPKSGMLYHSDRCSQYASEDYREVLKAHGIDSSMSRKADYWDNAVAESFFATIKKELIYEQVWSTHDEVRLAITEYIEVFYNRQRLHSYLDYMSPADYEKKYEQLSKKVA
jgi:putative transposase